MRISALIFAASLATTLTGAAWAQGAPGGNGSGGNVTGGSTTGSSKSDPGNAPADGKATIKEGATEKGGSSGKEGGSASGAAPNDGGPGQPSGVK